MVDINQNNAPMALYKELQETLSFISQSIEFVVVLVLFFYLASTFGLNKADFNEIIKSVFTNPQWNCTKKGKKKKSFSGYSSILHLINFCLLQQWRSMPSITKAALNRYQYSQQTFLNEIINIPFSILFSIFTPLHPVLANKKFCANE